MLATRSSLRPILSATSSSRYACRIQPRLNVTSPFLSGAKLSVRHFSSQTNSSTKNSRWNKYARIVRFIRIPVLVGSVYQLGYQQGIIEYARNPAQLQENLLDSVLAGVGCTDRKDVDSASGDENIFSSAAAGASIKRVARVGNRIIKAALVLSKQKQQEAADAVKTKLPEDVTQQQFMENLHEDDDFMIWTNAVQQLEGSWTYMLVDSELPNAFVTEILPRHIFITTTMLNNMITNDDELSLVLGHELSHMLLGHISEKMMIETLLRTIEVLILSMDPTSGLMSLGVVGTLATIRTALTAAHSRENENQADEYGIQLAAMACYDTQKAAEVFRRLHEQNVGPPDGRRLLSFADSHPPSYDRYERLVLASDTENVSKYADTTCGSVGSRLRSALNSSGQK